MDGLGENYVSGSPVTIPGAVLKTLRPELYLERLIASASPSIYQLPNAPSSRRIMPELFGATVDRGGGLSPKPQNEIIKNALARKFLSLVAVDPVDKNDDAISTMSLESVIGYGVVVSDRGNGTFLRCMILRNRTGFKTEYGGSPNVSGCGLHSNALYGLEVLHNGKGQYRANKLSKNRDAQVMIHQEGDAQVFENEFFDCSSPGVLVTLKARSHRISLPSYGSAIAVEHGACLDW